MYHLSLTLTIFDDKLQKVREILQIVRQNVLTEFISRFHDIKWVAHNIDHL